MGSSLVHVLSASSPLGLLHMLFPLPEYFFCHQLSLDSIIRGIPATLGLCAHLCSIALVTAADGVPNGVNKYHRGNKHMGR